MPDALDEQIEAFEAMLPELKRKHEKPTWVLVARRILQGTFRDFSTAALHAEKNFPDEQVLIRNTKAREEFAPFIIMDEQA